MSDMEGAVRSNWFRVRDVAAFKAWFADFYFGDNIEVWDEGDSFGVAFGGYESYPNAWPRTRDEEDGVVDLDLEAFAAELRKHLAPGEIFSVVAAGHEKLRYVACTRLTIDHEKVKFDSIYSDDDEAARTDLHR